MTIRRAFKAVVARRPRVEGMAARKVLIAALIIAGMLVAGCGASDEGPAATEVSTASEPTTAPLEPARMVLAQGEPFRIDASSLPPPLGEQPLIGTMVLKILSLEIGPTVKDESLPFVLGARGANLQAGAYGPQGMYVAVFYSVTNETQGALRPDSHINGAFSLADEAGRQWTAANFGSHSFAVAAAFALQAGLADPRDWVEAGDTATSAIAFDIPVDATGIRLRSELLGVAVSISEADNVVLAVAQPTAAPTPAPTAAPTAAAAAWWTLRHPALKSPFSSSSISSPTRTRPGLRTAMPWCLRAL